MTEGASQRGTSLVGVLLVLVVLAALAAIAVAALPGEDGGNPGLVPGSSVGGSTQPGRPASPVAPAVSASCLVTVRTVETAAAAKQAADGAFPASADDLVAGGWLSEAPALRGYVLRMDVVAGRSTGKVLVNDLPADQGCAAPPRPSP